MTYGSLPLALRDSPGLSSISLAHLALLKTHLRTYIKNILSSAVTFGTPGFTAEGDYSTVSHSIDPDGSLIRVKTKRNKVFGGIIISSPDVARAVGMLGDYRWGRARVGQEEEEEEIDLEMDEAGNPGPTAPPAIEDSDDEDGISVPDEAAPPRRVERSRSRPSSRGVPFATSSRDPSPAPSSASSVGSAKLSLESFIALASHRPIVYRLPSSTTPLSSDDDLVDFEICPSHPGVVTMSSFNQDADQSPPIGPSGVQYFLPTAADIIIDSDSEDDDYAGLDAAEEEEEERMERLDRARDETWEEQVWEIVQRMDGEGAGWITLGWVVDQEDSGES